MMVSVIVPVFNGARFVQKCVESVFMQTDPDCEIVIVDDGSEDNLPELAETLQQRDSRVRYVRIDNSGVTAARKRGIDEASGKWICFLDVDDTLPPDALKNYSTLFEDNPDIIASGEQSMTLEEYKAALMRRKSHPELWGKLFKADFIKRHYPVLDRSITVGEDQTINLVLACHAEKFVTIPELQYCYNVCNPDSVTKRFRRTADYEIKFERVFDKLVRPVFEPYSEALQLAEYKMKIEGFKMVVLDGNRFDCKCSQWRTIKDYYERHPDQLAASEKLLLILDWVQWLYAVVIRLKLTLLKLR